MSEESQIIDVEAQSCDYDSVANDTDISSVAVAAHAKPAPSVWRLRLRLIGVTVVVVSLYLAINPAVLALLRPFQIIYENHNRYENRILIGVTTQRLDRAEQIAREIIDRQGLDAQDNVFIGVLALRNRHVWLRRRHGLRDALRLGEADVTLHWDGQRLYHLPPRSQLY